MYVCMHASMHALHCIALHSVGRWVYTRHIYSVCISDWEGKPNHAWMLHGIRARHSMTMRPKKWPNWPMDVTKPEISGVAQFSLNRPSSKNPFIRHWCENRGPQFQWFIRHAHKFPYWNSHFGVYAPFSFDTIIHLPDFTDISRPAFQSEDTGIHGCPSTQKTV